MSFASGVAWLSLEGSIKRQPVPVALGCSFALRIIIIIFIYPLSGRVVWAPQMISQPVFFIFCVLHCPRGLVNSRPVHSLMLSSHLFFCLPCLFPPFTVPCKIVFARLDEQETCPYHCSLHLFLEGSVKRHPVSVASGCIAWLSLEGSVKHLSFFTERCCRQAEFVASRLWADTISDSPLTHPCFSGKVGHSWLVPFLIISVLQRGVELCFSLFGCCSCFNPI